jgi:HAD superfamily hydrolase (TIGR01509 family)
MPGARELISALHSQGRKTCVVTHSAKSLVDKVRSQNPILDVIPYWLTREDYSHPKPNPECYINAIQRYAAQGDKIIGFEDAPRGLMALMETQAQPVIVCEIPYPELPQFIKKGVVRLKSLHELTNLRKI